MDKYNETINKTGELYADSYHCCEAIVLAVSEHLGYKNDLLLGLCSPFGGGLTGNGAACGSLIAAYLCMGIFKGRISVSESRDSANAPAGRIYKKFCQKYGSPDCRNIKSCSCSDPKAEICIPLAKQVTRWILEELECQDGNE